MLSVRLPSRGQHPHLSRALIALLTRGLGMAGLALSIAHSAGAAETVREPAPEVLILNSYAPGYHWSDDEQSAVIDVFRKHDKEFEPIVQYLDFKRFTDSSREEWLLRDVADKCRVRSPALIVTLDDAAFAFALKYREALGPNIPIVFGGVNRFVPAMIAGQHKITGVSEESDYSGTFRLIAALRPNARRVLIASNRTPSGQASRAAFEARASRYAERYSFEYFDTWTNEELFSRLERLSDDWVVMMLDSTRDAAGVNNYNSQSFVKQLAVRPRVPVFINTRPPGPRDWAADPLDCLGGGLVSASVHGTAVGEIAWRVAKGESADAIPVVGISPQRIEVEYRQMQRFGLKLDQLPADAFVINAPESTFAIDRTRFLIVIGLLLVLGGVGVTLHLNIFWRLRAERALRRAEEQMRGSQKLEAIGLLAGGIAHDFNNLLQVIRGHAGFLHETITQPKDAVEDVAAIRGATERAAQLTGQLLAFSRKQTLRSETVDPNALVTELAKLLRRLLGEHIQLEVVPLAEPLALRADKGQLEQVILNLCVNARDAMPTGGRILIELRRTELAEPDTRDHGELKPGPHLVITVSDTGVGMTREVQQRIFEPFFTTKESGRGTGLGLAVVYGVVRQHGGTIRVYSEPGKGSVFRVLLPIDDAPATAPTAPEAVATFPAGSGTILLAEDDAQVRRLGERILRGNGFEVLVAEDGEEALVLIARHSDSIRLAVLDVLMPRRNGRQVFDHLRVNHPRIPVLFCSGYSAEMLPPEIAPEAGLALVSKPYSSSELLGQVHRLLAR